MLKAKPAFLDQPAGIGAIRKIACLAPLFGQPVRKRAFGSLQGTFGAMEAA